MKYRPAKTDWMVTSLSATLFSNLTSKAVLDGIQGGK
jgi:hypothetical protein